MMKDKKQSVPRKVYLLPLLILLCTAFVLNCSETKPPTSGVFIKNPDQEFQKIRGRIWNGGYSIQQEDIDELPHLNRFGKIVFYGANINYANLLLGYKVSQTLSEGGKNYFGQMAGINMPIIKGKDGVNYLEVEGIKKIQNIRPGIYYLIDRSSDTGYRAWFFYYIG